MALFDRYDPFDRSVGQPSPQAWLSAAELKKILAVPNLDGRRPAAGLRDRAIMETLYSTGLRRMELARLNVAGLDFAGGAVRVRQGKGRKDRVIPIGERALLWIGIYLADAPPKLATPGGPAECGTGPLFLAEQGRPLTLRYLSTMFTRYVNGAGLGKAGSCHLFRHTCATLILEHGADIRHVQEQLGYACLRTTEVYTHVSIRKLKEVHAATHPGAKLAPPHVFDGGLAVPEASA